MGGATNISICFNGIKSVNIKLIARLSVVYLTICILDCDEVFYKYTRKLEFNVEPAISFFLKMLSTFLFCCKHSNALQTRFFMELFFMEENVTEQQPNLDPYCLKKYVTYKIIKYIIRSTVSYIRKSTD